ncbi:hypothetical protein AB0941_23090 [Streptomyces sp. NPDC013433]|uniref:hypothetical protein n=1 Tax=Streptomyces sp. NPDC013433 TaxID=3155604 RepID=UPI003454BA28
MRTRLLCFGLYADEDGPAWVGALADGAAAARGARLVGRTVVRRLKRPRAAPPVGTGGAALGT